MYQAFRIFLVATSVLGLICGPPANAEDSPGTSVLVALDELHEWIADPNNAARWDSFLMTAELRAEIEKGSDANRTVLTAVIAKYESDTPGLDKHRFVVVREAVKAFAAELPVLALKDLPQAALDAKLHYAPVTAEQVNAAKDRLMSKMKALNSFLGKGSVANQDRWKDRLQWSAMESELNRSDAMNVVLLRSIVDAYRENISGLEHQKFTTMRDALDDYVDMVIFSSDPKIAAVYEKYLDDLSEALAAYQQEMTHRGALVIGRRTGFLQRSGQADDLVDAIRVHHRHPNIFVEASEELLAAGIADKVEEVINVQEVILGTRIRGTANTVGQIALELVPNSEKASLQVVMRGTAESRNVGVNSGVTVRTTGTTKINAAKRVDIDEQGFHLGPTIANCTTRTKVTSLSAKSAIVENAAWNRVKQQKSQGERIASRRAENRVAKRVDEEANPMLAKANQSFLDKFRNPLLRRGEFPPVLQLNTSDERLFVKIQQSNKQQIAASGQPPALGDAYDLAVRLHESAISNFSETAISDLTLTDVKVVELLTEYTDEVPEELRITEESDPWSITFASNQPVRVSFADGFVTIIVRGKRFTRGEDQEIKSVIDISAVYALERSGTGMKLSRQGEVQIDFANKKSLSVTQVAFKTFLRKKFEAMFKPEFASDGWKLPGRWELAGTLYVQQIQSTDGWLSLGWNLAANASKVAENPADSQETK